MAPFGYTINEIVRFHTDFALKGKCFRMYQDVKEAAYKALVRPVLEYGSSNWDPTV